MIWGVPTAGGLAVSTPTSTALVGPGGVAISAPSSSSQAGIGGIAIAGIIITEVWAYPPPAPPHRRA